MLDFEIVPELGLRSKCLELLLGMPMQECLEVIRTQDDVIKSAEFWYSDRSPLQFKPTMFLPYDGLKLYFDPSSQKLQLIEIFDMSKVNLIYWSQCLNSSERLPKLDEILRIFGATKSLDSTDNEFKLCYRGITFYLSTMQGYGDGNEISDSFQPQYLNHAEFFYAYKLFIYSGSSIQDAKIPSKMPLQCFQSNIFTEKIRVNRSNGLTNELSLEIFGQDNINGSRESISKRCTRVLQFSNTVQDVMSALGSPSKVFYKTADKMKIHLPQSHRVVQADRSNYFFNYFTLGLDILFDARTHKAIKFILHTNQPGEYTFNMYHRCNFEIPVCVSPEEDSIVITPFTKWSEIKEVIGNGVDNKPVVIHREIKSKKNPFEPTHAYGFEDLIFEVIPSNELLASVTMYAPPSRSA